MTEREKTAASKFISLVLRHDPKAAGLTLDRNGWADVSALLAGMNRARRSAITLEALQEIVKTNDKQRFSFNEDGTKIRANQGHSLRVDVELKEAQPPQRLYHGTVSRFLDAIRTEGLKPQSRLHVHLSADEATAIKVGKRRGSPVVLMVDAERMYMEGYIFYLSENGVWLTGSVPARFLLDGLTENETG